MNVTKCEWEESSIDSGFSSDVESSCKRASNGQKGSSWYYDMKNIKEGKSRVSSRSLPSQFRKNDFWKLNEVVLTDFSHIRNLGGGGFAKVDLVELQRQNKSKYFALKQVSRKLFVEPKQEKQFEAERHVLSLSYSRFIPRLFRTFYTTNHVFLVIEACLHGDLFSYLERHGPMRCGLARYVIGCITEALFYLHKTLNVIHRDVKTENILIGQDENPIEKPERLPNIGWWVAVMAYLLNLIANKAICLGVAKVADLGFCKTLEPHQKQTNTFCGTPGYIAPEVLLHTGHSYSADYFSLGVVTYEVLTCRSPFRRVAIIDTHKATLRGITDVVFPNSMSHVTKSFVRGLCYREPDRRLGEEIRSHEWFYGFNWKELRSGQMLSPLQLNAKSGYQQQVD